MKVLIDNGHGDPPLTGGKCSPDNRLKEYIWCREIAQRLSRALSLRGYDAILLTPETTDISLTQRVRRANGWCSRLGDKNVVLVSIHNNAAGSDGKWHDARGFSVFVAPKSSQDSKRLASLFTGEAKRHNLMGNRFVPACGYWEGNFAIIRDTRCPAVLTENLFQDNKLDVEYLLSEEGKTKIVQLHADAIAQYIRGAK